MIAGAGIDSKGNLVIAGSTSSPDFPLVSPLTMKTPGSAAFIVKIDSQLKNITFATNKGSGCLRLELEPTWAILTKLRTRAMKLLFCGQSS